MVSQKNGFVNTFFVKKAKYAKKSVQPAARGVFGADLHRKTAKYQSGCLPIFNGTTSQTVNTRSLT